MGMWKVWISIPLLAAPLPVTGKEGVHPRGSLHSDPALKVPSGWVLGKGAEKNLCPLPHVLLDLQSQEDNTLDVGSLELQLSLEKVEEVVNDC